ncbi:MAG: ORF6N domain-containing protein [Desulfobacteraceae bacterium]|jgi:hypothetical protein|nr:MAG: ORF6N domain-containing protein [Desulfobacteraceae bacterium]
MHQKAPLTGDEHVHRFPEDFMFELTKKELNNWRSQFAPPNHDIMGLRIPPVAFTEHGVLMRSSIKKKIGFRESPIIFVCLTKPKQETVHEFFRS